MIKNRKKGKTGLVFFPAFDWAVSPTHPEREERLLYTQDQLREEGIFDLPSIEEYKPNIASSTDIRRTHFCFPSPSDVVTDSHRIAAGGAITIAELLISGEIKNGFALVRPPGHHAMKSVHGNRGFCNINNEAIMIEYLREHHGIRRIAVVDTDCHHGDGTQDIYWYDPHVLYISLHQDGRTLFPGSGFVEENGGGKGAGKTVNIPLPPNTADEGILYALNTVVMPLLDDFGPEIVINSAGQDNHFSDPITNMRFSAGGYAELNSILKPDICVLEGGYSIKGALPYVNLGIVLALAGEDYSSVREPDYNRRSLREKPQTMDEIKRTCEKALASYFQEGFLRSAGRPGPGMHCRTGDGPNIRSNVNSQTITDERTIFYDTSMIQENRRDTVSVCGYENCPGYRLIETSSRVQTPAAGIEIPVFCCDSCYNEAMSLIDELGRHCGTKPGTEIDVATGTSSVGGLSRVSVINRRDKSYYDIQ